MFFRKSHHNRTTHNNHHTNNDCYNSSCDDYDDDYDDDCSESSSDKIHDKSSSFSSSASSSSLFGFLFGSSSNKKKNSHSSSKSRQQQHHNHQQHRQQQKQQQHQELAVPLSFWSFFFSLLSPTSSQSSQSMTLSSLSQHHHHQNDCQQQKRCCPSSPTNNCTTSNKKKMHHHRLCSIQKLAWTIFFIFFVLLIMLQVMIFRVWTVQLKLQPPKVRFQFAPSSFWEWAASAVSGGSRSQSSTRSLSGPNNHHHRVAVLMAGSLQKFHLQATAQHLIQPLVKQEHSVDCFFSFGTNAMEEEEEHASLKLHWDPLFSVTDSSATPPDTTTAERVTRQSIVQEGGVVRTLLLKPVLAEHLDDDKQLKQRRRQALQLYPNQHPDFRFPIIFNEHAIAMTSGAATKSGSSSKTNNDNSNNIIISNLDSFVKNDKNKKSPTNLSTTTLSAATMNAATAIRRHIESNQKMLRLSLETHGLWNQLKQVEQTTGNNYDYVMFLREDTLFLADFDLNNLLNGHLIENARTAGAASGAGETTKNTVDVFALACDAEDQNNEAARFVLNDDGMIVARDSPAANIMGNYYTELFKTNVEACAAAAANGGAGAGGCSAEMLLRWILVQHHKVKVHKVGQNEFPFQRSLNVAWPSSSSNVQQCFHTYCQSKKNKLSDHGLKKCSELAMAQ